MWAKIRLGMVSSAMRVFCFVLKNTRQNYINTIGPILPHTLYLRASPSLNTVPQGLFCPIHCTSWHLWPRTLHFSASPSPYTVPHDLFFPIHCTSGPFLPHTLYLMASLAPYTALQCLSFPIHCTSWPLLPQYTVPQGLFSQCSVVDAAGHNNY